MSTRVKSRPRFARLLPSVVLVGTALLALNASGIVHDAYALAAAPVAPDAMTPAPAPKDLAVGGDSEIASAAEVDVLTALAKRRGELDQRQSDLATQANMLSATETRVDAKIAQLKALQTQITALLAQRDAAQEKQLAALVKTYSAMKPKDAARIFESLNPDVLLAVAQEMKSDVLAPVLAAMSPAQAQTLTVKLADKLALPETAAALSPVSPSPVPAAPGPVAAIAAPAPAAVAAAAPAAAAPPKTGG